MFYKLGTHLNAMESPNPSQGKNSKNSKKAPPRIIDEFGSLIASLVARYLDSRTAVRLLRKTAKRCSPAGALRLWTFDCYNEQQANELASEVDRDAVIVARVHWSLQSHENQPGPHVIVNMSPFPDGYFRHCESICLVGFPRYLEAAVVDAGTGSSIRFMPHGNALTARDGWAAVFAEAPAAPQGVTRRFRLRVNDVSRTFFSTFQDGRHGSSNFCELDDDDDAPVDVRLDWLPVLPASRFRVETRGDDRAAFIFDRSLARGMAAEDAIMSPRRVFGNLSVLVFPAGRTEETRGRVGIFLRLMVYDEQGDARSRHFDVAVDGRRVGTISNEFGMDRELVGLDDVGASDELFPRRGGDRGQIVVEFTERPATNPGWICGTCDTMIRCQRDSFHIFKCTGCGTPAQFTITRALGVMA